MIFCLHDMSERSNTDDPAYQQVQEEYTKNIF